MRWIVFLVFASPAVAQQYCAPREIVIENLRSEYDEQMTGGGVVSETVIFEIWVSDTDGSWTILKTQVNGMSCIMASGTHWRRFPPSPIGEKG